MSRLHEEERRLLLRIARQSVENHAPGIAVVMPDIPAGSPIISTEHARDVFVPQAAERSGGSVIEFLGQTRLKAGFNGNPWQTRADVHQFSAIVFGETLNS